jgi:hypothetical protein
MSEYTLLVLGTIFGGINAVGATVTIALMWREAHPPSAPAGARRTSPAAKNNYWPWLPVVLIALAALPPAYLAYRLIQGFQPQSVYETPPPGSARMDVWKSGIGLSKDKHLVANIYVVNNGKTAALNFAHEGSMLLPSAQSPVTPDLVLDAIFEMLRTQLSLAPIRDLTVDPNQNDVWFSIFGQEIDDKTEDMLKSGAIHPYALALMKYRDDTVPVGKFIYTESCKYWIGSVLHYCEAGHNRVYMAQ